MHNSFNLTKMKHVCKRFPTLFKVFSSRTIQQQSLNFSVPVETDAYKAIKIITYVRCRKQDLSVSLCHAKIRSLMTTKPQNFTYTIKGVKNALFRAYHPKLETLQKNFVRSELLLRLSCSFFLFEQMSDPNIQNNFEIPKNANYDVPFEISGESTVLCQNYRLVRILKLKPHRNLYF